MLSLNDVEQFAKENNVKYQVMDEKDFSTEKNLEGIKKAVIIRFDDDGNATGYSIVDKTKEQY